ncbi:MAG: 2'-5' RNA ligase family protein [Aggregatilineales bacterium]
MALAIISYPTISDADRDWIKAFPEAHSKLLTPDTDPHFTFVFPFRGVSPDKVIAFAKEKLAAQAAIPFAIRAAIPVKEYESEYTYLYLVPDDGLSAMIRLHDYLYTDLLEKQLNLDIPFFPHITAGHARKADLVKEIADDINVQNREIQGTIETMSVVKTSRSGVEVLENIQLTESF